MDDNATAMPMVGGLRFDAPEPLKEETKQAVGAPPSAGLEPR